MKHETREVAYIIIAKIDGKHYSINIDNNKYVFSAAKACLFYNEVPPRSTNKKCQSNVDLMWKYALMLFQHHKKTTSDYLKIFRLNSKKCPVRPCSSQKFKKSQGKLYSGFKFESKPDFVE